MGRAVKLSLMLLSVALLTAGAGCRHAGTPSVEEMVASFESQAAAEEARDGHSFDPSLLEVSRERYKLGPGDVIEIFATDIPELNRKYTLGPDGRLTLPAVGVVDIDGLTREEASRRIEKDLQPFYRNPRVDILVAEYLNNRIYVLGEVRKPGEFNFKGRPMLLSALALAQGLTDQADMRACTIVRGKDVMIQVDLYELLRRGNRSLNLPLMPEDTVYVGSNQEDMYYVLGQVQSPGAFPRTRRVDVVRAVAKAGGLTENAIKKEVRLIRRRQGRDPEIKVVNLAAIQRARTGGEEIAVMNGDIIYVPRRALATFNYVLRQVTPSLNLFLLGDAILGDDED
ncbi:polysaccharide biosynthesis/export family protein [Kiritimatiella glycovorans]|uniref:Polysialic acid transport protein KpsD n=1 Tax=Kiritimatiella glycovorans TaxID=1307763 RepID=A0A0G3EGI3_9BACT|nr:polysaccharide biosynthesis/export family protein [Kiritimatiella glycovorans]AKJ63895.1 Polysialic acid transport protein KpsD precursor [Kiritimatiella glycovorans]